MWVSKKGLGLKVMGLKVEDFWTVGGPKEKDLGT